MTAGRAGRCHGSAHRVAVLTALTALTVLAVVASALAPGPRPARAQQSATGIVSGRVTSGTVGETVPDGLTVQLIALEEAQVTDAVTTTVRGGRFEVSLPAVAARTYVPRLVYQDVAYYADAVTFTADTREVQRDFLVYAATHDAPALTITSTVVTVVAIDRERGQLGLVREDMVANPDDRVFVGDDRGVTLHIPAPDGTIEAAGEDASATFTLERGVVTTTVPIRPGKLTAIVTRYLVGYDAAADRYRLRVTAPLPAERLAVRVPVGYVRALEPAAGAARVDDERLSGELEGVVLQVAQSTAAAAAGRSILVDLVGLSRQTQSNALTDRPGVAIAAALALAMVGGATAAAWRWRGRAA